MTTQGVLDPGVAPSLSKGALTSIKSLCWVDMLQLTEERARSRTALPSRLQHTEALATLGLIYPTPGAHGGHVNKLTGKSLQFKAKRSHWEADQLWC